MRTLILYVLLFVFLSLPSMSFAQEQRAQEQRVEGEETHQYISLTSQDAPNIRFDTNEVPNDLSEEDRKKLRNIFAAPFYRVRMQLAYNAATDRENALLNDFNVRIRGRLVRVPITYEHNFAAENKEFDPINDPGMIDNMVQPSFYEDESNHFDLEIKQHINPSNREDVEQTFLDYQVILDKINRDELIEETGDEIDQYRTAIWIEELTITTADDVEIESNIFALSLVLEPIYSYGKVGDSFIIQDGATPLFGYDESNGNIEWDDIANANSYELEYVFIDNYKHYNTATVPLFERLKGSNNFRRSSVDFDPLAPNDNIIFESQQAIRIITTDKHHRLRMGTELTYPEGVIFFRIRGVGQLTPGVIVKGDWIYMSEYIRIYKEGQQPTTPPNVFEIMAERHQPDKNWQYTTVFAEEGKYKKVMSYFDASLRNNQTLTNFSTDREDGVNDKSITLVEEAFNDYEGRGVIKTIPTPLNTPDLSYQVNPKNLDIEATNVDERINFFANGKSAYDKMHNTDFGGSPSEPLEVGSLSREYYSANRTDDRLLSFSNSALFTHDAYVPESNGYAYTQVKYTNDGTGRVSMQSGVGEDFVMGAGREVQYFYLTPSQKELKNLFGDDVGDASHYKKVLSIDPNGQKSVAYIDQAGQTIATALVGKTPTKKTEQDEEIEILNPLRANKNENIVVQLNSTNQRSATISRNESTFYNPIDDTEYKFKYDMKGGMTKINGLDPQEDISACLVCTYELTIYLLNAQGAKVPLYLGDNTTPVTYTDPITGNTENKFVKVIEPNSDDNINNDYQTDEEKEEIDWCEEEDDDDSEETGKPKNRTLLDEIVLSKKLGEGEYTLIKELKLLSGDGDELQQVTNREIEKDSFIEDSEDAAEKLAEDNCTYCASYIDENGVQQEVSNNSDDEDCPNIAQTLEEYANQIATIECDAIWQKHIIDNPNDAGLTSEEDKQNASPCYKACKVIEESDSRQFDFELAEVEKMTLGLGLYLIPNITQNDPFWSIDFDGDGNLDVDGSDWGNSFGSGYEIELNGASINVEEMLFDEETYRDINEDIELSQEEKNEKIDKRRWKIWLGAYQLFKSEKTKDLYNEIGCDNDEYLPSHLTSDFTDNYDDNRDEELPGLVNDPVDCNKWAQETAENFVYSAYSEAQGCESWDDLTATQYETLIQEMIPLLVDYCKGDDYQSIDAYNMFRNLYYDPICRYNELEEFFEFVKRKNSNEDILVQSSDGEVLDNEGNIIDIGHLKEGISSYTLALWFDEFITEEGTEEMRTAFKAHFTRPTPSTGADPLNPFHYEASEWNVFEPSVILAYIEMSIRATSTSVICENNEQGRKTNLALDNIKTLITGFESLGLCLTPFYKALAPVGCRAYDESTVKVKTSQVITYSYSEQVSFGRGTGIRDVLRVPRSSSYDNMLEGDFTIDAVVDLDLDPRPTTGPESELIILSTESPASPSTPEVIYFSLGFKKTATSSNSYRLYFYWTSGLASHYATSNEFVISGNTCSRVTLRRDKDGTNLFLFDGLPVGYNVDPNSDGSDSDFTSSLAGRQFMIGDRFIGVVQELRLWSDISIPSVGNYDQIPNEYVGRFDLLGYWKLQRENEQILDYSIRQNHIPFPTRDCEDDIDPSGVDYIACHPKSTTGENCMNPLSYYVYEEKTIRVCKSFDDNLSQVSTYYTMDDAMEACKESIKEKAKEKAENIRNTQNEIINAKLEEKYKNDCFSGYFRENLIMEYSQNEYHYTLYYYDQAGNLYQTVPPEGVNGKLELGGNKGEHTMITQYHYNTLGQVVWQKTPDAGESQMWIDYYGRVRLSQNAEQKQVDENDAHEDTRVEYSYSKYDDLGRPYEAGKISLETTGDVTSLETVDIDELIFDDNFPQAGSNQTVRLAKENTQLLNEATTTVSLTLSERSITYYDDTPWMYGGEPIVDPQTQRNLRNRVASVAVFENEMSEANQQIPIGSITRYSYDIHGNVEQLWQKLPNVSISENTEEDIVFPEKTVRYDYDLLSGKVNQVIYQEGEEDEFRHHYIYDGDNRLVRVRTSTDGVVWNQEAEYFYYAHGPLARVEIGEHNLQGVDYYYTLQGWIKGVNTPNSSAPLETTPIIEQDARAQTDLGKDGHSLYTKPNFSLDEFAYTLHYFEGDYVARGGNSVFGELFNQDEIYDKFINFEGRDANNEIKNYNRESLYNGNVASMTTSIAYFGRQENGKATQSMNYCYDQLHRITAANAMTWSGTEWTQQNQQGESNNNRYQTSYVYDANGNIEHLRRANQQGGLIDNLAYTYYDDPLVPSSVTHPEGRGQEDMVNRLYQVVDDASNGTDPNQNGLDMGTHEYEYDEIGNLIKNGSDGIDDIQWNIQGKVERVTRGETIISYQYDASGNRIIKQVATNTTTHINYYLRDVQGNTLAIYEHDTPSETNPEPTITLKEMPIYGGSRLGQYRPSEAPTEGENNNKKTALGQRYYEFSNHLQNVLVVLADYKVPQANDQGEVSFKAIVVSANDYYPFGMTMGGGNNNDGSDKTGDRAYQNTKFNYRYGFNGQEKSDELDDNGNSYTAEYWQYDSRIARRWNVDPVDREEQSPYLVFHGNPIRFNDINGDEPPLNFKHYPSGSGGVVYIHPDWKPVVNKDHVLTQFSVGGLTYTNLMKDGKYTGQYFDQNNELYEVIDINASMLISLTTGQNPIVNMVGTFTGTGTDNMNVIQIAYASPLNADGLNPNLLRGSVASQLRVSNQIGNNIRGAFINSEGYLSFTNGPEDFMTNEYRIPGAEGYGNVYQGLQAECDGCINSQSFMVDGREAVIGNPFYGDPTAPQSAVQMTRAWGITTFGFTDIPSVDLYTRGIYFSSVITATIGTDTFEILNYEWGSRLVGGQATPNGYENNSILLFDRTTRNASGQPIRTRVHSVNPTRMTPLTHSVIHHFYNNFPLAPATK